MWNISSVTLEKIKKKASTRFVFYYYYHYYYYICPFHVIV